MEHKSFECGERLYIPCEGGLRPCDERPDPERGRGHEH